MKKKFIELEHTADAAIQVWGESLSDLFINATEGMYHLIFGDVNFECTKDWQFSASSISAEDLLVEFLNELNYWIIIKKQIVCLPFNLRIERKAGLFKLSCNAYSTEISAAVSEEILEIKAVTYHALAIVQEGYLLTTRIVFDL